jgi:hypothetical protein
MAPGWVSRHAWKPASAAARSGAQGLGRRAARRARNSSAGIRAVGRPLSGVPLGAVVSRAVRRPSRAAPSSAAWAAAARAGQSAAAAQPSSTTSSSGPSPAVAAPGPQTGRASPSTISAAAASRSSSSHQGVRLGVCSGTGRSRNSRTAGKDCRRGAGGVTRNSHQMAGRSGSASSNQGSTKLIGPSCSIRSGLSGREGLPQRQQSGLGRVVGTVGGEAPAGGTGDGGQPGAVGRQPLGIQCPNALHAGQQQGASPVSASKRTRPV